MSKKPKSTAMWHLRPDSPGWWLLDRGERQQLFVNVEENGNDLKAWVIQPIGNDGRAVVVFLEIAASDEMVADGWYWQPIKIPTHCPEFDMEDE